MSKRLRSLASLLWDADADAESAIERWNSRAVLYDGCTDRCVCVDVATAKAELQAERTRCSQLENENVCLREQLLNLQGGQLPLQERSTATTVVVRQGQDPWQWLEQIHPSLRYLPRFQEEVLADLKKTNFADGRVSFRLASSSLASTVLGHGESVIRKLSGKHPALYKVGITCNPIRRWCHSKYGYVKDRHDKWDGMLIIHTHEDPQVVCFLEAALIRVFLGCPGCRNTRLGGEGVDHDLPGPFFCYVVHKVLTPPCRK